MVKKTKKAEKKSASERRRSPWSWVIFAIGILLLVAGGVMYGMFQSQQSAHDHIKKLPSDAYVAGIIRVADLNHESVKQLATSTNIYPARSATLLDALATRGVTTDKLTRAFQSHFAFALTTHGGIAIGRVKDEAAAREVYALLTPVLENQTKPVADGAPLASGALKDIPMAVGQDGPDVYIASNAELIATARNETNGFTSVSRFADVAESLATGRNGYVFYNAKVVRDRVGADVPLFGLAYKVTDSGLDIDLRTASTTPVANQLSSTSGKLLPPPTAALVSIEGEGLLDYLHLLEEQRQETNIPKVLSLQNGIVSLGRSLGVDFEKEYLAAPSGHFTYARFRTSTGIEWMGATEFPDAETAVRKVSELQSAMAAKLTIPIRKQVVRILPDGTQSREVVSEGRQPLGYSNFTVGDKTGSIVALPGGIGLIHFIVQDKYLIVSSSPEGVSRMLDSVGKPSDTRTNGELAVRLKLSEAHGALAEPDTVLDWILVTRPSKGDLRLDKATGILEGTVGFEHGS